MPIAAKPAPKRRRVNKSNHLQDITADLDPSLAGPPADMSSMTSTIPLVIKPATGRGRGKGKQDATSRERGEWSSSEFSSHPLARSAPRWLFGRCRDWRHVAQWLANMDLQSLLSSPPIPSPTATCSLF